MIFAHFRRLPRLIVGLCVAAAAFTAAPAWAQYKGAIAIDAATGKTLFEDNADFISPPASVTKLMTFLIVHDAITAGRIALSTPVTATATDQSMGGTQVNLAAGETFTVEELLYAVMVESANDAAHALSHTAAPSREEFVGLMNARARSLGMKNTTFRSPHGLPPSSRNPADADLTTPRDLAILARELVLHTDILRYSSVRTRPFGLNVRATPLPMLNHNKLLGKVEGLDGLKTGFTRGAGFCLAATAQRGNKRVIVVTMGSASSKERDLRIAAIIEQVFPLVPPDSVFHGYVPSPVSGAPALQNSPVSSAPVQETSPVSAAPDPKAKAPVEEVPSIRFTMPPKKK